MSRITLTPVDTATGIVSVSSPPAAQDSNEVAAGDFAAVARKGVILSITADYAVNVDTTGTANSDTEYTLDGAVWNTIHNLSQSGAGTNSETNRVDTIALGNLTATQMNLLDVRARARANSTNAADAQSKIDTWSISYLAGIPAILAA